MTKLALSMIRPALSVTKTGLCAALSMTKPAMNMIKPTLSAIKPALSMIKPTLNITNPAHGIINFTLSTLRITKPTLNITKPKLSKTYHIIDVTKPAHTKTVLSERKHALNMTILTRVVLDRPCLGRSYDLQLEEGFCDVLDSFSGPKRSPGGRYDNLIKPALSITIPAYSITNLRLRSLRMTKPTSTLSKTKPIFGVTKPALSMAKTVLSKIKCALSMTVLTWVVLGRPRLEGSYDLLLEEWVCYVLDSTSGPKPSPGGMYDNLFKPALSITIPAYSITNLTLRTLRITKPKLSITKPTLGKAELISPVIKPALSKIKHVLIMVVLTRDVLDRPCPGGSYDLLLEEGFCDVMDGASGMKCSSGGRYTKPTSNKELNLNHD